jgi:hypothetical protein
MINLTLDLVFKKQDSELLKDIQIAIEKTRKIFFQHYSNGVEIEKEAITAGKKTISLAFCKCYDMHSIDNFTSYEDFIKDAYSLWISDKQRVGIDLLKTVLPTPFEKLAATQIHPVIKGLGLMLFILWTQDAIILTPEFKMPTIKKNRGNIKNSDDMGKEYATELISYFLDFRKGINKEENATTLLETHEELTPSLQNNLQSYGWRFLVSTDWHKIEDADPDEAMKFMELINQDRRGEQDFVDIPVPMKSMFYMLQEHYPDRVKYNACSYKFKIEGKKKKNKYTNESPENISKVNDAESETYYKKAPQQTKYWVDLEKKYIKLRRKKGYKSSKKDHLFLSVLNHYLFVGIPKYQKKNKIPIFIPSPSEYTRQIFEGTERIPSLLDFLGQDRKSDPLYDLLRQIDLFFDYIETIADDSEYTIDFKNPINRTIDFSLKHRRQGTSKVTISQRYTPSLLSYVYAIYEFACFVHERILDDPQVGKLISSKYRSTGYEMDYIDTAEIGMVPFIYYGEKIYPIYKIHKSLLNMTRRFPNGSHKNSINLPNISYLAQFLVAFETGIRNIHLRWFDRDLYDKDIDRSNKILPPICPLTVNTDKTKKEAWTSWVSSRVIEILDKLKSISEELNEPWINQRYFYDNHEETDYDKIKPIFSRGGITNEDGKPFSETSYSGAFVLILNSFQEFCNKPSENSDKPIFSEKINFVTVETVEGKKKPVLSSDVSPHSARATLVSNHIKILPPYVIGQYCTGHETEACVAYYTVVDSAYMNKVSESQSLSINGNHPLLNGEYDAVSIQAEDINSLLRQAIGQNINAAFSDFGAVSFEMDDTEGKKKSKSGIEVALALGKNTSTDQIAFNSTHLCPYNNCCPDDYQLLDEFRGLIRSVCDATNTTIEDLSEAMNTELQGTKIVNALLEIS